MGITWTYANPFNVRKLWKTYGNVPKNKGTRANIREEKRIYKNERKYITHTFITYSFIFVKLNIL